MPQKRTLHVYRSNGSWVVKKEGVTAETFSTRRAAVTAARERARRETGQLVVYGPDGGIRKYETYGMAPVPDPPRKSRMAGRIGRAVGSVALKRIQSDDTSRRAQA